MHVQLGTKREVKTMDTVYAVLVRDANGKLLGRLAPDGTAVKRNIYAAMLPKDRAERVAAEINEGGEFQAKAIKF